MKANYPGLGDVVAEEVEVPGHDGAMIPLSIMYRKGIPATVQIVASWKAMALSNTRNTPHLT